MRCAYISGRVGKESAVIELHQVLQRHEFSITYDWTTADIRKPYLLHTTHNRPFAEAMRQGACEAEIFILFWHPTLLGALIELGMSLGTGYVTAETRRVYIIGQDIRESLFYTLPEVTICQTTDDVIRDLKAAL